MLIGTVKNITAEIDGAEIGTLVITFDLIQTENKPSSTDDFWEATSRRVSNIHSVELVTPDEKRHNFSWSINAFSSSWLKKKLLSWAALKSLDELGEVETPKPLNTEPYNFEEAFIQGYREANHLYQLENPAI